MNDTGTNTADITSVMDMMAPPISLMASMEALRAFLYPISSLAWTASTTTMASSTTMAMASTRAASVSRLMEKPITFRKNIVPISDTGTAIIGMSVERKSWRKMNTTMNTSTRASIRVLYTSCCEALMNSVTSCMNCIFMPGGKFLDRRSAVFFTSLAMAVALEPARWVTIIITAGWPSSWVFTE